MPTAAADITNRVQRDEASSPSPPSQFGIGIGGFPVDDCFGGGIGRPPLDGLARGDDGLPRGGGGELVTFEARLLGMANLPHKIISSILSLMPIILILIY
jgi:hypothetical protein